MSLISTLRHHSIFDADKHTVPCTIIGCGAIGSRVFESLVSLGVDDITCYDFDHVEAHNIANQIYGADTIGLPKVTALQRWHATKIGSIATHSRARFYNTKLPDIDHTIRGIVFLAVDSFAARREIADMCLIDNGAIHTVIDFRMGALHGNVLTFDPLERSETAHWLSTLGSDDPALSERSPCGTSITVGPTASIIANIGIIQFINWATNPVALEPDIALYLRPLTFCPAAPRSHAA